VLQMHTSKPHDHDLMSDTLSGAYSTLGTTA